MHAMTHPGARRRVRRAEGSGRGRGPQPDPNNAASAFLDALAREVDEEGDQEIGGAEEP